MRNFKMRKRGTVFCVLRMVARNPSLTLRVVINPCVFAVLISPSPEQRNFKKRQRGIKVLLQNPVMMFRVGANEIYFESVA